MRDLQWLGLTWDEGPDRGGSSGPYTQQERYALYDGALSALQRGGLLYPCYCSRARLQLSERPRRRAKRVRRALLRHDGGGTSCDAERPVVARPRARCRRVVLRRRVWPAGSVFAEGLRRFRRTSCRRLVCLSAGRVRRRRDDGHYPRPAGPRPAVVDGAADLAHRIPRYPAPQYTHVPMLIDGEGRRLSKRQQGITIESLRDGGATATAYYPIWRTKAAWYPNGPVIRWKSWRGAAI